VSSNANAAAFAALDAEIARVRALGDLGNTVAPAVATALHDELARNITAGRSPDGEQLQRTREGKQPLRNAAKALTVRAIGTTILAKLTGIEARHNNGGVRGGIKRPMLPSRVMPQAVTATLRRVINAGFTKAMRRG
jgi:hypothetical protein